MPTTSTAVSTPIPKRPSRNRKYPKRYGFDWEGPEAYFNYTDLVSESIHNENYLMPSAYINMLNIDMNTGIIDKFEPDTSIKSLKATLTPDPDFPNFKQAMEGPHREEFLKVMLAEIKQLQTHKTWSTNAFLRSNIPNNKQVIPLTWIFKIKRHPSGEFHKFKARL